MRDQVEESLYTSSRLVSEQFDAFMVDLEGTVQLIVEAVQDRVVGYPYDGWEEDLFVPFHDMDSQTNMYPLAQPPPPMDWNITPNLNAENAVEHGQERAPWLAVFPLVSTASGAYFMQGACNQSETDASAPSFYPNCTEANNDFETGGVVQPTKTNKGLYQRSGDLVVFLKALWESQKDALVVGVYFHNSGAGSQVTFPGFTWSGPNKPPYMSAGCDWMKNINPYTGDRFATDEEIARCHPKGTLVPQREYNPMERPWCQMFALNPSKVWWYGPYQVYDHGILIMTVGRAIFDRR